VDNESESVEGNTNVDNHNDINEESAAVNEPPIDDFKNEAAKETAMDDSYEFNDSPNDLLPALPPDYHSSDNDVYVPYDRKPCLLILPISVTLHQSIPSCMKLLVTAIGILLPFRNSKRL
jgi:hypothetical protein